MKYLFHALFEPTCWHAGLESSSVHSLQRYPDWQCRDLYFKIKSLSFKSIPVLGPNTTYLHVRVQFHIKIALICERLRWIMWGGNESNHIFKRGIPNLETVNIRYRIKCGTGMLHVTSQHQISKICHVACKIYILKLIRLYHNR